MFLKKSTMKKSDARPDLVGFRYVQDLVPRGMKMWWWFVQPWRTKKTGEREVPTNGFVFLPRTIFF